MNWVDIGINLTNRRYNKDRQQVIKAAIEAGVSKMIVTGTSVAESKSAQLLCQAHPGVLYSTSGCHPHDAKSLDEDGLAELKNLAHQPSVVAIGECGLDFNRNFSSQADQIRAFEQQLTLAVEVDKPLFLHERDAFDTQYQILKDYMPKLKGAIVHCFTGNQQQLEYYLELGLSVGITGWICDERRGQELYSIVGMIPDDRLMVETDGPYLTPRDLRPKPKDGRNEPKFLPHIGETIARARGQSIEHVAQISFQNSLSFFNL